MNDEGLLPISDPHDLQGMDSLSNPQRELLVQWFAKGLRETEIIGLAEDEWNMILTRDDVRLLYATHRSEVAKYVREQSRAVLDSPHLEPAYQIQQLDMLARSIAGMLDEAIEEGAVGPTDKLISTYLKVVDRMSRIRKQLGVDGEGGKSPIQEKLEKLPEGKRAEAIQLLHKLDALVNPAGDTDVEEDLP